MADSFICECVMCSSLYSLWQHSLQAEHIQKKRLAERLDRKQQQQRLRSSPSPTDHGGQRVEIWISSDGHSSCDPVCDNDNDNDDITKMSNTEVSCCGNHFEIVSNVWFFHESFGRFSYFNFIMHCQHL